MRSLTIIITLAAVLFTFTAPAGANGLDDLKLGANAVINGDWRTALDLLSSAIVSDDLDKKELAKAYFLRGKSNEALGYTAEAERDYSQAVWNDDDDEYRWNLRRLRRNNKGGR